MKWWSTETTDHRSVFSLPLSHLFDGAVLRLWRPYPPLVEEVQGDEERGAQGSHGGGQGDGDVPEENHRWSSWDQMCVCACVYLSLFFSLSLCVCLCFLDSVRVLPSSSAAAPHVTQLLRLFLFRDAQKEEKKMMRSRAALEIRDAAHCNKLTCNIKILCQSKGCDCRTLKLRP